MSKGPVCRRCQVPMKRGQAFSATPVMGVPDFHGNTMDSDGQTITMGGPGKLVSCWKCPGCGHSIG